MKKPIYKPMNHDAAQKNLVGLAAGSLTEQQESSLHAHLQTCAECSQQLETWQRVTGALERLPAPLPAPARLARIAALARSRREEVIAERWNRLVFTGLALFVGTFSFATLQGIWAANQWVAGWSGWTAIDNPWTPVLLWLALTWMAALALLPLLREYSTSTQENVR
jgi:anti-sigma factor RsiW